ncbi:isoprenylcysteine alpha-carbonyl methylesterase [Acrasis kona]|uniref:Isoprenylcysteine alpha-carbonyl methylesterase n=1 Tax=Acrasis kona TaxID=1008807 RepID=A0AAW2ZJP6_9EUKA
MKGADDGVAYRWKQFKEILGHIIFIIKQIPWFVALMFHYHLQNGYTPGVNFIKNINYDDKQKGHNNYLNLYVPQNLKEKPELIMFVHGGGWNSGNPVIYHHLGVSLAKSLNTAVAIVGYRKHPHGDITHMIHDVSSAIGWCKTNSSKYNINSERIHLFGHSAGAHIIFMSLLNHVACLDNIGRPKSNILEYSWSMQDIKSITAVTGVYDIVQHYEKEVDRGVEMFSGMAPAMLRTRKNFERFSPLYVIRECIKNKMSNVIRGLPPIMLIDVETDTTVVSEKQTLEFLKCIKEEVLHPCTEYICLEGFGHSDPVLCLMHNRHDAYLMINCISRSIKSN